MVSDTPGSDGKESFYFTHYPKPACNPPYPLPSVPRASPSPALVMQTPSAWEARWEESAVAPPLPCRPHPAGLLGLWPEGFLISVCACDRAGLECEQ